MDLSAASPPSNRPASTGRLDAPTTALDLRVNAYRPDLAHVALAGRIGAQHYAEPMMRRCSADVAGVYGRPVDGAEQTSQLLRGEPFEALDIGPLWTWGQCGHDRYVGYVRTAALAEAAAAPTHRVVVPHAHAFAQPSIKAPPTATLLRGALVAVVDTTDGFARLDDGGHVRSEALAPLGAAAATDWVGVAMGFLHTPYLWGGRSRLGIDCSGLVQIALQACGQACPRDSDQQRAMLGEALPEGAALRAGDLVFFPGHVGIMADADLLLHANAHHMATVLEPLAVVIARVEAAQPMAGAPLEDEPEGTGQAPRTATGRPVWAARRLAAVRR